MPEQLENSKIEPAHTDKKSGKLINEVTYGLGRASEGGFLLGLGSATVAFLTLYFGSQRSKIIGNAAAFIESRPEKIKSFLSSKLPNTLNPGDNEHIGTALAVAGIFFVFAERLGQIPSYFLGKRKAKEANHAYNDLQKENEELKKMLSSGGNKEPVEQASGASAKRPVTFAKALQQEAKSQSSYGVN